MIGHGLSLSVSARGCPKRWLRSISSLVMLSSRFLLNTAIAASVVSLLDSDTPCNSRQLRRLYCSRASTSSLSALLSLLRSPSFDSMAVTDAYVRIVSIGLYRDVWIAAIASSRTSLATLTGAMCKTSQCELRSLRVNSGMLNVIRIMTYYTLPPLESPDSFWIAMAISR